SHERPTGVSLVRWNVLKILAMSVESGDPIRIVPHRYVDKGGVCRVELFEIPVPKYSDPDSVSIDRVNGDEPGLGVDDTLTFLDGSGKDRYIRKNHADRSGYTMITTTEFGEGNFTRTITRKRKESKRLITKKLKNDNVVLPFESSNDIVYSFLPRHAPLRLRYAPVSAALPTCRGVGNKKHQRKTAAMLRNMQRQLDFDHAASARETERALGEPDHSASVAANIAAFDKRQAEHKAKSVDPIKAGKKVAKLAAFKAKQKLHMENECLRKASDPSAE
ncbi:MAG: hypothetical protein V3S69_03905, partial [Dehalococcoidales bacterium]